MIDPALSDPTAKSRLSLWQAAWVIARRDFVAILFSRAFGFFLLGPLFPVLVGGLAGGIGGQVQREAAATEVGVIMSQGELQRLAAASYHLRSEVGGILPPFNGVLVEEGTPLPDPRALLNSRERNYAAVLSGTLEEPVLTGTTGQINRYKGPITLLVAEASAIEQNQYPDVVLDEVQTTAANVRTDRIKTAQAAQMLLFLLTMLLAGMVLSNLVEEKANKIIEILAAAIPMDAVFVGKLFAMLGISIVGIAVWGGVGGGLYLIAQEEMGTFPAPTVGWPMFFVLGGAYFTMAYLLLGSLFLTIGALASTVREVQTLSMPVTMAQLLVFFFAAFAITYTGTPIEIAATIFPLSSPFAMLARAAMVDGLWQHAIALVWQALWVVMTVKFGAALFRKRVMKSGNAGVSKKRRGLFRRTRASR